MYGVWCLWKLCSWCHIDSKICRGSYTFTAAYCEVLLLFQKSCQIAAADWGARGGVLVPRVAAAPEDVSAVAEARVSNAGMADLAAAPRNIDTAQTPEQPQ